MKTADDYRRYETAARGMSATAQTEGERGYFAGRADLHRARALREHLRTTEVHARYIAGVDLDGMTFRQLIAGHDDMPGHVQSCYGFPSDYA